MASRAVFLSYASEDAAAARRLCDLLRAAGIEVWFDQSELRGGDAWDRQIRKQIHDCALFIAVISTHSNARGEGYFRREWRLAVERTHDMADDTPFLLPVVIDDTAESGARVPEPFRDVQWTRVPEGQASVSFVERVQRLLSPEPVAVARAGEGSGLPAAVPRSEPTKASSRAPNRRWPAVAIGIAALLVLGYLLVAHRNSTQRAAAAMHPAAGVRTASSAATMQQKSIAVLAFADMSEKKDQEYFADGMAEEILDLLTKIPGLRVIGRTSSFQFKARNEDLRSIGEKLGAGYLVEGSVRKAGSRIRVTAQLIDAASGTQLWADSYDREFGDVLNLQDQVAAGIARALQLAVVAEDTRPRRPLQSTEAYTHYLRGRAALDRGDASSLQESTAELEQALALDPEFTRAAEALALAHLSILGNNNVASSVGWSATAAAAQKALQLDPKSALAHAIVGLQHATYEYNWPAAKAEFRQALAVNSRDPVALYLVSWLAFDLGEHAEAVRLQNLSISIDPLNPDAHQNGGIIDYLMGNLDAAERSLRTSLQISPTYSGSHWFLGQVYLVRGDVQKALKEMQTETSDSHDLGLALVYHALGRNAEAEGALARATRSVGDTSPMNIAIVHAYLGKRDLAFFWLTKAVDEHDIAVGAKFRDEPKLEPLRSDPRYKALLRKMNLPDR